MYTKYREKHQWQVYIKEQNRYIRMQFNKRNYITTKVTKATNNSRHLFKIIGGLLGRNEGNPIPQDAEDRQLAEDFVDYLLGKIEKIRENLKDKEPYKPCQLEIPQLTKFAPVTEQELGKHNNYTSQVIPTRRYTNRQAQTSTRPVHPSYHAHH